MRLWSIDSSEDAPGFGSVHPIGVSVVGEFQTESELVMTLEPNYPSDWTQLVINDRGETLVSVLFPFPFETASDSYESGVMTAWVHPTDVVTLSQLCLSALQLGGWPVWNTGESLLVEAD